MTGKLEMEIVKMSGVKSPNIRKAAKLWEQLVFEEGRLGRVNKNLEVDPNYNNGKYRRAKVLLEERIENIKVELQGLGWKEEGEGLK